MIRVHVAAFRALLNTVTSYDGQVPNSPVLPYLVLYADQGATEQSDFTGAHGWRLFTVQTTCVGTTPEQARWVAEKVEAAVHGVRPTVAGRTCSTIRKVDGSQFLQRDDDVDPPLMYAIDRWQFMSTAG